MNVMDAVDHKSSMDYETRHAAWTKAMQVVHAPMVNIDELDAVTPAFLYDARFVSMVHPAVAPRLVMMGCASFRPDVFFNAAAGILAVRPEHWVAFARAPGNEDACLEVVQELYARCVPLDAPVAKSALALLQCMQGQPLQPGLERHGACMSVPLTESDFFPMILREAAAALCEADHGFGHGFDDPFADMAEEFAACVLHEIDPEGMGAQAAVLESGVLGAHANPCDPAAAFVRVVAQRAGLDATAQVAAATAPIRELVAQFARVGFDHGLGAGIGTGITA